METELDELLEILVNTKGVRIQSVFSHLVASEDSEHDEFTRYQIDLFFRLSEWISNSLNYSFMRAYKPILQG
jgi:alanine racemase